MGDEWGMLTGFSTMFAVVSVFIMVVFAVILAVFIANAVKSASRGAKNNAAPEVTAQATIVDKRTALSSGGSRPVITTYTEGVLGDRSRRTEMVDEYHFVTFEQAGGERFEMQVPASDYGLLVVGDQGVVTMKGARYLGFQRELMR